MPELLKNIYNDAFFGRFLPCLKEVVPLLDTQAFLQDIYDQDWEARELKQRMRHITLVLKNHLSGDYKTNVDTLLRLIPICLEKGFKADNLEFFFLPDFLEVFGQDHHTLSMDAIERITQFVSCEFAMRPFIIKYPGMAMEQMGSWSRHEHYAVRRLSSEGCRPRLPWAMALPVLKKDPAPILPILENLKNDSSAYVRRSVANNLNDISKDHPKLVIDLVKKWKGKSPETDKLIKHACRTLLKEGNSELMQLFGFGPIDTIKIMNFKVLTPEVHIGDSLEFQFELKNIAPSKAKIRLEYGIYYQKANGSLSRKVFKISEKEYPEKSSTTITRKQPFAIITTRKLHAGEHRVSIIANGTEFETLRFQLKA